MICIIAGSRKEAAAKIKEFFGYVDYISVPPPSAFPVFMVFAHDGEGEPMCAWYKQADIEDTLFGTKQVASEYKLRQKKVTFGFMSETGVLDDFKEFLANQMLYSTTLYYSRAVNAYKNMPYHEERYVSWWSKDVCESIGFPPNTRAITTVYYYDDSQIESVLEKFPGVLNSTDGDI